MNKKKRRHSGRITPQSTIKTKKETIINECLEPQEMYDEWLNYRDGIRGYDDQTKLRSERARLSEFFDIKRWNKKIKKLLKIRKSKHEKEKLRKECCQT